MISIKTYKICLDVAWARDPGEMNSLGVFSLLISQLRGRVVGGKLQYFKDYLKNAYLDNKSYFLTNQLLILNPTLSEGAVKGVKNI